jgi:hypothetical protein
VVRNLGAAHALKFRVRLGPYLLKLSLSITRG